MIVRDPNFPSDPKIALRNGVAEAEKEFLGYAHDESINNEVQRAGSCAIIVLIVGEIAYVANVGDSRAVMSVNGGRNLV
jgi:protein phosphatase 2C family protein 2/3